MQGRVRWFDSEAGYGIIRTDQGVDVLVQRDEISPQMRGLVAEQAVEFDLLFPAQGAEASVVRKPGSTPRIPDGRPLLRGWVRAFDERIGRGIIRSSDDREVAVRRQAIQKSEPTLEVGEEVEFDWVYPTQRIEAINVTTAGENLVPKTTLPHTSSHAPSNGSESDSRLRVFLCHSSIDKPRVRQLRQQLSTLPILPWLDEEQILPGKDWQHEIMRAMRASHVVLICLSAAWTTRPGFAQREIGLALDIATEQPEGTIFVVPLKFDQCDVPERLRRLQWVEHWDVSAFSRLTAALRSRALELGLSWRSQ